MVIGDVDNLAFEFLSLGNGVGELYLLVKGQRIGPESWDYDLASMKNAWLYECKDRDRRYYPALLSFSSKELAQIWYCVLYEYEDKRCERYRFLNIGGEDIGRIFFYSIPYLLDGWGVGLVQSDAEERFFIFDEDKDIYIDVTVGRGYFYSLVMSLIERF
ncbi:hypothetical protein P3W55_28020 [Pseudomonas citronellolis]|jgi:hypothetical protein|uniref:Uncharacterized protein n=1 Tax=Pseudomonas citronellolis TaxID=53408 RepID=A0AAW6PCB3_9PSED|nr:MULTISPECIES: hypothetical protein [Pseudomonas]MDF3845571.1 hypothetical protein [Pseudomonas citronellolis]WRT85393.1 hypothetical protein VK748_13470 [Pseudomonas citronellolis]